MQVVKLKAVPDEVPSYNDMLKSNDSLFQQHEIEITRRVLMETLDVNLKVKPLFVAEVVKAVGKILEGSGYGTLVLEFQDGNATFIKSTENIRVMDLVPSTT